jgi:hypothetical protein
MARKKLPPIKKKSKVVAKTTNEISNLIVIGVVLWIGYKIYSNAQSFNTN